MVNGGTDPLSAEHIDVNDQGHVTIPQELFDVLVNDLEIFTVAYYDLDPQTPDVNGDEYLEASHNQGDVHAHHEQRHEDLKQGNGEQLQPDHQGPQDPGRRAQQVPSSVQWDQSSGLMDMMDNYKPHNFQQSTLGQLKYRQLFRNGTTQLQTANPHPIESSPRLGAHTTGSEVAPLNPQRDLSQSSSPTCSNSAHASSRDGSPFLARSHSNHSYYDASRSSTSPLGDLQSAEPLPQCYHFSPASSQNTTIQHGYSIPSDYSMYGGSNVQQYISTYRAKGAYNSAEERYIQAMISAGVSKEKVAAALGRTP